MDSSVEVRLFFH